MTTSRPFNNIHQLVYTLPRFYAGRIFFVDTTYGSNSGVEGNDPNKPLRSITYALLKCVDDQDDLIIVLNGYNNTTEDTETGMDDTPISIDKNGVTILFEGKYNKVQAIGSADSIFQIDANQVTLGVLNSESSIQVVDAEAGTTSTIVEIKTGAVDAEVFGFENVPGSTIGNYDELITIAATAHGAHIHDNHFVGDVTDADEGIVIEGTTDGVIIEDNFIKDCCAANGAISSGAAHTHCIIRRNTVLTATASKKGINFTASATGVMCYNKSYNAVDSNAFINGNVAEFENYANDAYTTSGFLSPAGGSITSDKRMKFAIVRL